MNNWKKVYSTASNHQAEIVKGVLESQTLPVVIMNRKDSSYLFGYYDVLVSAEDEAAALKIISDEIKFE